jgi:hypothetical protein
MGQDSQAEHRQQHHRECDHGSNSSRSSFLPPVAEMTNDIDFLPRLSDDG